MQPRFHIAFPVKNLAISKEFYTKVLGCSLGRESDQWVDFNFFGHQIVAHLSPEDCLSSRRNPVDGDQVPVRHFGVILAWEKWETLCETIKNNGVSFFINPKTRFKNNSGEQGTFFIQDPSGNMLEFKTFKNSDDIFKQ